MRIITIIVIIGPGRGEAAATVLGREKTGAYFYAKPGASSEEDQKSTKMAYYHHWSESFCPCDIIKQKLSKPWQHQQPAVFVLRPFFRLKVLLFSSFFFFSDKEYSAKNGYLFLLLQMSIRGPLSDFSPFSLWVSSSSPSKKAKRTELFSSLPQGKTRENKVSYLHPPPFA